MEVRPEGEEGRKEKKKKERSIEPAKTKILFNVTGKSDASHTLGPLYLALWLFGYQGLGYAHLAKSSASDGDENYYKEDREVHGRAAIQEVNAMGELSLCMGHK